MISGNRRLNPERTWDEAGPGIAAFDYSQCMHLVTYRQGQSRLGQNRWVCAFCRQHFTADRRRLDFLDELRIVAPLYKQGMTIPEVCRKTGLRLLVVTGLYRGFQRRWPEYYPAAIPRVAMEPDSGGSRKRADSGVTYA